MIHEIPWSAHNEILKLNTPKNLAYTNSEDLDAKTNWNIKDEINVWDIEECFNHLTINLFYTLFI